MIDFGNKQRFVCQGLQTSSDLKTLLKIHNELVQILKTTRYVLQN